MQKELRQLELVNRAANQLARVDNVDAVLIDVLRICIEAVGAMGGTIYMHEPLTRKLRFRHVLPEEVADKLERLDIPDTFGVAGEVFHTRRAKISDFPNASVRTRTDLEKKADVTVRSMLTLPLQVTGMAPIGVIQLVNKLEGKFDETDLQVLDTVSDICALAVMNSRQFEQRTRVAALEGMGRAAHDMANKAGVVVAFLPEFRRNLELLEKALQEEGVGQTAQLYMTLLHGTFADVFEPYSDRVYRYAKLVNNLAAGKPLEPKKKLREFGPVVREAAEFMEPQGREARARILYDIEAGAPQFEFDDLFVMRIVENLVGNALKAVKETVPESWKAEHMDPDDYYGTVTVKYRFENGRHRLEVSDTGSGMPPSLVREIKEGAARSSWAQSGGSGLGTKVVAELAATHAATLDITSRLGQGSTFIVSFPAVGEAPDKAVSVAEASV